MMLVQPCSVGSAFRGEIDWRMSRRKQHYQQPSPDTLAFDYYRIIMHCD